MNKIAVMYLCRFGNPPRFSRRFLESLMRFKAGVEFDLVYILKGFPEGQTDTQLSRLRDKLPCASSEVRVSDDLFSVSAHIEGARQVPHEQVLLLNSYSEVLAENWLSFYVSAFNSVPDCGIVGASGACASINEATPFPNTGIRTNAFFMNREVLLNADHGPLKTQWDNNLLEAGPNSLSKQMVRQNKKILLVGRNGKVYEPKDWPQSRTWRSGSEENLLVSDNRSYNYAVANYKKRQWFADYNWRDKSLATPSSLLYRLRAAYHWRFG